MEIQGNIAVVQNMSVIIATEVGQGLGVAMQNASKVGPAQAGGTKAGDEDTKIYTQDQNATLLGFHGVVNVKYPSDSAEIDPTLIVVAFALTIAQEGVASLQVG